MKRSFTLCQDEETRQIFIDNLLNFTQQDGRRHTLIITMRSDYESRLMRIATFQKRTNRPKSASAP
ncbi:MAG: hypothetical protein M5U34_31135 [Chloroflexi bacterium]|nr:hypothetical protein [Chloroflexota bacterium]